MNFRKALFSTRSFPKTPFFVIFGDLILSVLERSSATKNDRTTPPWARPSTVCMVCFARDTGHARPTSPTTHPLSRNNLIDKKPSLRLPGKEEIRERLCIRALRLVWTSTPFSQKKGGKKISCGEPPGPFLSTTFFPKTRNLAGYRAIVIHTRFWSKRVSYSRRDAVIRTKRAE